MADVNIFIDNVKKLCKENNLLVKQLLIECNLNKDFLNSAKKRQTLPSAENILTIAEYFNVSIDFILGIEKKAARNEPPLDNYDVKILENISDLTEDELKTIFDHIQFLKHRRNQ